MKRKICQYGLIWEFKRTESEIKFSNYIDELIAVNSHLIQWRLNEKQNVSKSRLWYNGTMLVQGALSQAQEEEAVRRQSLYIRRRYRKTKWSATEIETARQNAIEDLMKEKEDEEIKFNQEVMSKIEHLKSDVVQEVLDAIKSINQNKTHSIYKETA